MLQVKVRIKSFCDGRAAEEQRVQAVMTERNGKFYLLYDEPAAAGLGSVRTTLKWTEDNVLLLRSGAVKSRQEFRAGLRHADLYRTPWLEAELITVTKRVAVKSSPGRRRIELDYDLLFGSGPASLRKVLIEIEEEAGLGH